MDERPNSNPPPRPTKVQVDIPKPLVPEVSLMADTEESVVWRPQLITNPAASHNSHPNRHNPTYVPSQTSAPISNNYQFPLTYNQRASPLNTVAGYPINPVSKAPLQNKVIPPSHPKINHDVSATNRFADDEIEHLINPSISYPSEPIYQNQQTIQNVFSRNRSASHSNQQISSSKGANQFQGGIISYQTSVTNQNYKSLQSQNYSIPSSVRHTTIPENELFNMKNDKQEYGNPEIRKPLKPINQNYGDGPSENETNIKTPTKVRFANDLTKENQTPRSHMNAVSNITPKQRPIEQNHHHCCEAKTPVTRYVEKEYLPSPTDPHVYKLIEGQNQQILHLQKVMEKILDVQSKEGKSPLKSITPKVDESLYSSTRDNKRVAIVQTSHIEEKPTTRSVGVNTDISWNELLRSIQQNTPATSDEEDAHKRPSYKMSKDPSISISSKKSELIEHCEVEMSVMMRDLRYGLNVQADPPSPEPSIHVQMPEESEYCARNPRTIRSNESQPPLDNASRLPLHQNHSTPTIGQSEDIYQRQDYHQRHPINQPQEGLKKDPSNDGPGVTFYNNVNNILQNLNRAFINPERQHQEPQHLPPTPISNQGELINRRSARSTPQIDQVKQHLLDLGISFIPDPRGLQTNQRPIDTVYMPDLNAQMSLYEGPTGALQAALAPYNHQPTYSTEPQNEPSGPQRTTRFNDQQSDELNQNYSTQTRQFFQKYNFKPN